MGRNNILIDLIETVNTCELDEFRHELDNYKNRTNLLSQEFWTSLQQVKKTYVLEHNELLSKVCWCFETIGHTQDFFIQAFLKAKEENYYDSWCEFEKCEIALNSLKKHCPLDNRFGLRHMEELVPKFQDMFPYTWFVSPGLIIQESRCSICNEPIKFRKKCGHVIGEIYNGEQCNRIITKVIPLEISIVNNPVQKYSVLFGPEIKYNYGLIKYVFSGLRSPWHKWSYEKQKRSEEIYPGAARNSRCPCGSGKKYKNCCLLKKRIKDHFQIIFEFEPPKGLPSYIADCESYS